MDPLEEIAPALCLTTVSNAGLVEDRCVSEQQPGHSGKYRNPAEGGITSLGIMPEDLETAPGVSAQ